MEHITVINRDGQREPLDIRKIQKYTALAVAGLEGLSQSELEVDAQIQFRDGMTTKEIQRTITRAAVDKIDIDAPLWTFAAARLLLFDVYHQVSAMDGYGTLESYFQEGEDAGRIIYGLKEKFVLPLLDKFIDSQRDYQFNYLGLVTLVDRYLLKNQDGVIIELPQHMFMGVAMYLSSLEVSAPEEDLAKFISEQTDEVQGMFSMLSKELQCRSYWAIKFYDMISKFEVMLATPTLSNGRTPRSQLSSCYIGSTGDNIEGIFDVYKDQALLSKFGGGIGWDWCNVRAMGSFIDKHQKAAGGTVPFLKIENDVAIAVDQLGTRKGAIAVYIEPWHLDVNDFLDLKKNAGEERRRAHDLFPALWVNDLFMARVASDSDWTLFDPYDTPDLHGLTGDEFKEAYETYETYPIRKETMKAKTLWKKILTSYFETGSPFLCFKDTANRANPNKHSGFINSSNLCTEIFQNTSPDTYLMKIEMEDGNIYLYEETAAVELDGGIVKSASKIATIDYINGSKVLWAGRERVYGDVAVCNLGSVNLSKIHSVADIARIVPIAIRALDNVIDLNYYPIRQTKMTNEKRRPVGLGIMGEHEMLVRNGIMFGTNEHFVKIDEIMEHISFNAIKASADIAVEKGSYPEFEGSEWSKGLFPIDFASKAAWDIIDRKPDLDWNGLKTYVAMCGMRNGHLLAIAPTSSISILVGTTQTIEPVYKRKWFEENLSGLIPVVAPGLCPDTWALYKTSYEYDQTELIKAAAIRQKWIDQGQSLNIFLKLEVATGKHLNDLYMLAWKLGNKSTYYLRSQSPEAKQDVQDRSTECEGCQ